MKKKVLSIVLSLIIVITSCSVIFVKAQDRNADVNKLIFENILENRSWIIETLINGDYSNNPYTEIVNGASETSFFQDVLTNYENDIAFKGLVNALEIYKNTGTYAEEWILELAAYFLEFTGQISEDEKEEYVTEYIKSVDDLQYESILNSVLSEDYTSSWGATLFESDSALEHYRSMADMTKKLDNIRKSIGSGNELLSKCYFEDDKSAMDYADNFLEAYEDSLYEIIESIPCCGFVKDHRTFTKKLVGGVALGFALEAGGYSPFEDPTDTELAFSEFYSDFFSEDVKNLMSLFEIGFKFNSIAAQHAILLNTLVAQKSTTLEVMKRIDENTVDEDLSNTLNSYSKMFDEQGNVQFTLFDSIVKHVNNQSYIGKGALKGAKNYFNRVLNETQGYFDCNKMVMTNSISEGLSKAGQCVSIAVWVADKATNIQDTAKKVYLCTYIEDVLDAAINTYEIDYIDYLLNPTEENAKKCLDDLEFIKKIRLFGEKQAYGSVCEQTDSIVGMLLGSDKLHDDIEQRYQGNVDSLLGCSLAATSVLDFNVSKDETLTLWPYLMENGKYTIVASYIKADGTKIYFPEADVILMSVLKVNGGTVNIIGLNNGINCEAFFQKIESDKESEINIAKGYCAIGEIENNGTLTINLNSEDAELTLACNLINTGSISIDGSNQNIYIQNIENTGTITAEEVDIDLYGSVSNNGSINGKVNIIENGSRIYDEGYYETELQTLSGSGTYTQLNFDVTAKKGVKIADSPSVTQYLSISNSTRMRTPENLYISGNCAVNGNALKYNVRFKDYTAPSQLDIKSIAEIYGNCTFKGGTVFNNELIITESCTALNLIGEVVAKSKVDYRSGTIQGEMFKIYDDLIITASSPGIAKLCFAGLDSQTVSSTYALTVNELDNHNISINGVSFNNTVYVTDMLLSDSTSAYENGKNIVLKGKAKLNGNVVKGSISAQDWTCTDSAQFKGSLYTSGDIVLSDGVSLSAVNYNQSSGTLALADNSALNCKVSYKNSGSSLTVGENATINTEDFSQSGTTVNNGCINAGSDSKIRGEFNGGVFKSKGSIVAEAPFNPVDLIFESKLPQSFTNSAETNVTNLTITNSSSGFTVGNKITVSDAFYNNCTNLINRSNIVFTTDDGYFRDGETQGDMTLTESFTVRSGETLKVNGNLTLSSGADLDIAQGGNLIVNGKIIMSSGAVLNISQNGTLTVRNSVTSQSGTITVEEGALLYVNDYFSSTSDTLNIAGELVVNADASLTSSDVTANGLITFKGDLKTSSCTWNSPNIAFVSKLPQNISGSAVSVNNLNIQNGSTKGITIGSSITYSGEYSNNGSVVTNETNIVSAS